MAQQGVSARTYFFFLLLAAFAAAIIGDNAAESLLLSHYDAVSASRMFAVNAILLFIFSIFSMSVVDKFNRAKLAILFILLLMMTVLLCWGLVHVGFTQVFFLLYMVAYTGKIFLFFFVWTLANDVADSRSGAKDFPLIAAGGTFGAILTTFLIPRINLYVEPTTLLLIWLIPLTVALVIVLFVFQRFGHHFVRRREGRTISLGPGALFKNVVVVYRESVLRSMAIAYGLLFFLIFVQQFHFYGAVQKSFDDASEISTFLGYFYGVSMLSTLLIQTTVAGAVTRRLGIIRSLFFQPFILGVSFVLLAATYRFELSPALYFEAIVAGVGLRIAFMDSFFTPNYQNFFSTLPQSIRGQSKLAIEGVIKPIAMISASLWVALIPLSGWNTIPLISIALLAGITIWDMKRSYVATLVNYLAGQRGSTKQFSIRQSQFLKGSEGHEELEEIMASGSQEVQMFVAHLVGDLKTIESDMQLMKWYYATDFDQLKRQIIKELGRSEKRGKEPFLYEQLLVSNPHIVSEALTAIGRLGIIRAEQVLPLVESASPEISSTALVVLAHQKILTPFYVRIKFEEMLQNPDVEVQGYALSGLGKVSPSPEIDELLRTFWYSHLSTLVKHSPLLNYYLLAVKHENNSQLLREVLDMVPAFTEVNVRLLTTLLVEMCRDVGAESILSMTWPRSHMARAVVLEALGRSGIALSGPQKRAFTQEAQKELQWYQDSLSATRVLRNFPEDEVLQLLADGIERDEARYHRHNALWIGATLDTSRRISSLLDQHHTTSREVRARILEVVDTLGNSVIRQIFRTLYHEDSLHLSNRGLMTKEKIYNLFIESPIPIVVQLVQYARMKGGEHETE